MTLNMNSSQSSDLDHMIVLWTPGSCIGLIRQELVGCCMRQTPADHAERCRDRVMEATSPVTGDATSHFCAWLWFAICHEQKQEHQESG